MSRPLVCLTMILKDEAHCIRKTLESVKTFVDCWAIVDTGSTDGTQSLVREIMAGVPGRLCEEPFVDFATSRNRALQLAKQIAPEYTPESLDSDSIPVFTLMLSADETFSGGAELRAFLETQRGGGDGAYSVVMLSERSRWSYPRVLRVDAGWSYVGEVHEVPVGPAGESGGLVVSGVTVSHEATDPDRRTKRMREFDLPLLSKMVEDEARPLSERAQAVWFLAQTYDGLADRVERTPGGPWVSYKMMAMSLYWRRMELGGLLGEADDALKAHYAFFRYMNVAEQLNFYTDEELLTRLNMLVQLEPRIPEVHYMMAVHAAKLDVRQGLFFAEQAARVARETLEGVAYHLPMDLRLEWLSLAVAAACARQLDRLGYARTLAQRAIAAGAPAAKFEEYLALPDAPDIDDDLGAAGAPPAVDVSEGVTLDIPNLSDPEERV